MERCHAVERRAGVDLGAAVEEVARQLDVAGRCGLVEQAVIGRDLGADRRARQREQNRKGDGSAHDPEYHDLRAGTAHGARRDAPLCHLSSVI